MAFGRATAELRIRLSGRASAQADLAAVRHEEEKLAATTKTVGKATEETQRRSFLMNQALFTMRRYAYAATLGLTALGSAAVVMGIKFNASMEMNEVAFTQFLGSQVKARKELQYLYKLAKYTPFEFSNVTDAARRFLAFGFTVKEANKYLQIIGDSVAAFGGGSEQIERMVTVIGQVRASGRLLGQDMLQLEQQGIPVLDILQKQLTKMGYSVTRKQLAKVGELGIPSEIGIPALMAGMQERFGGMSAKQAKTAVGQWSTLHDSIQQVMGGLTTTAFVKGSKGILPALNKMFGDMGDLVQRQHGRLSLNQAFGIAKKDFPQFKTLIDLLHQIATAVKNFAVMLKDLLPLLGLLVLVLDLVLKILNPIIGLFAQQTWWSKIMRAVLLGLITSWLIQILVLHRAKKALDAEKEASIAWTAAKFVMARTLKGITLAYGYLIPRMKSYISLLIKGREANGKTSYATNTLKGRVLQLHIALRKAILSVKALATAWIKSLKKMAIAAWEFIADSGPIGWIIAAILIVTVGLVVLYFRWKKFHDLVNRTAQWLWKHWKLAAVALFLFFGPLAAFALIIAKHWKLVLAVLKEIWNFFKIMWQWIVDHWRQLVHILLIPLGPFGTAIEVIIDKWNSMWRMIGKIIDRIKSMIGWLKKIPGVAAFLRWTTGSGAPPTLGTPGAASPYAMQSTWHPAAAATNSGAIPVLGESPVIGSAANGKKKDTHITTHTSIVVDGKKIAEATSKHRQNKGARR